MSKLTQEARNFLKHRAANPEEREDSSKYTAFALPVRIKTEKANAFIEAAEEAELSLQEFYSFCLELGVETALDNRFRDSLEHPTKIRTDIDFDEEAEPEEVEEGEKSPKQTATKAAPVVKKPAGRK